MGFDDDLFMKEHESLKSEIKNIKNQMNKSDQMINFKNEIMNNLKDIKSNLDEIDQKNTDKIVKIKHELHKMKNIKDLVGNDRQFKTIGDCIKET